MNMPSTISNANRLRIHNAELLLNRKLATCQKIQGQIVDYLKAYYPADKEKIALYEKDVLSERYLNEQPTLKEETKLGGMNVKAFLVMMNAEDVLLNAKAVELKKDISALGDEVRIMKAIAEEKLEKELVEAKKATIAKIISDRGSNE